MDVNIKYEELTPAQKKIYDEYAKNRENCPSCGKADSVVTYVYGRPSNDLAEVSYTGIVQLKGCCRDENTFRFFCKQCNEKFN